MTLHQRRMRAWRRKTGRTKMPMPPARLAEALAHLDAMVDGWRRTMAHVHFWNGGLCSICGAPSPRTEGEP